jgi:hypothetical protein
MNTLHQFYTDNARDHEKKANHLQQRYNQIALIRLILFFVSIFLLIYLWTLHISAGAVGTLLFLVGFYQFMRRHEKLKQRQLLEQSLSRINRLEADAQQYRYEQFPDGRSFSDPSHPYSGDLDLFGPWSFFQYINRSSTQSGGRMLADWIKTPAEQSEIVARQEVSSELSSAIHWRQVFQALGAQHENEERGIQLLKQWMQEKPLLLNSLFLRLCLYLVPLLVIAGIIYLSWQFNWKLGLLPLLIPAFILWRTREKVDRNHELTSKATGFLSTYSRLILHVESHSFSHPYLKKIQQPFRQEGYTASREIGKLAYTISQLNVRYNVFAIFLNLLGLWDLQWLLRLEKWRQRNQDNLPAWFHSLATLDALNSLAGLHYNHPDWVFPEISSTSMLKAQEMGHPLIPTTERVCNDLEMPTEGHIKLITGSNMAGKSTFLRTVGLNIALANIGAPVCARSFSTPRLQVFTSMRIQDDLHESTSSFYAELKRLKVIIDAVEAHKAQSGTSLPVFFLLDEILKGTNSRDRHTGSRALIEQLIRSKGGGLIATHDLELGDMEAQSEGAMENLCMEVEVKNDELIFDYKLKKGVSKSFNATNLMKRMGIKLN